jgi:metal-responsive CopG/Arc/MetJ family transcriptional regulator
MQAKLDAWIARQPDPKPSRSEAIRRLIESGLGRDGA